MVDVLDILLEKNKRKISQNVIVHEKLETKIGINKISTYKNLLKM